MAVAGSLTYDTKIDKNGFYKGLKDLEGSAKTGGTKIKDIVSALGITKIISTAMNTIKNSIDGAVSRIDTLNNFPKVMSNLGIASEDSTKAINKLSDGLQGIPTTLDDAALAVQRFTSKNGDVDKSVDLFLAVNNALLAGGASADIQSTAMEQLSQSYAKGKPDMMEWRAIQTAMPAQLKQISKELLGNKDNLDKFLKKAEEYADKNPLSSTGKELIEQLKEVKNGSGDMTTALGTALRTGIISMDDFMDTIVKMNKEGSGEFKSFEEQAKNSTGGIKTSITNAKTAITRGVANIVKAFDDALKSNGLGGISTVISKIGKIAENILKKVSSLIPVVVSKIKDIYNWCMKHQTVLKTLVGVIASVKNGYLAYKAVLIAINAIQIAKNIISTVSAFVSLIPAIKSAKDAMLLLNMAFSANPVGLVVAGIVALTTAFVGLQVAQFKEITSLKGLKDEVENQKKSWDSLAEARNQSLSSSMSEISICESLRNELEQITNENGKVKEGYEQRAKFILGELNNALGTEYKLNGNIIGQYGELKKNIDEVIEKKKAEAILNAYQEEYTIAEREQSKATKTLIDLKKQMAEAQRKLLAGNYEERIEAQNTINLLGTKIKEQTDLIGSYGKTIQDYGNLQKASVEGTKEAITKAIDEIGVSYNTAKIKAGESVIEQINAQQQYVDAIKDSLSEAKNVNDIYQQQILEKQLKTNEEQLTNLKNNLSNQSNTIKELTPEQIEAWKEIAKRSVVEYSQLLSKVPETTREEIEKATGVVSKDVGLYKAMEGKATNVTGLFRDNLKLGEKTTEEINNVASTLSKDKLVEGGAIIVAENVNRGFNNNVNGKKWGADLSANIAGGMKSKTSMSKISEAATSIAGMIKSVIGHSVPKTGPLKDELTYMPDMIDNLVKGINKNKYKVARATNELAENIKSSFDLDKINNDMISKMQNVINIETGSINAQAMLKVNKDQPRTVTNDNGVTINNTQQFYSKNATPYEEQKQAKQQLRRLAYGL